MLISMQDLNSRKADIECEHSKIYFLSEYFLAKRFLSYSEKQEDYRLQRYEKAKKIVGLNNVSLPIDTLDTEKGFCGYIEPVIPGTCTDDLVLFGNIVTEQRCTITLDYITNYILKCANIVANCHKNGIVNPDMCTGGNVLYNKSNGEVYFTDFQDMQVDDIPTNIISDFITKDPILYTSKYYDGDMYSPNIDWYSLAIRFFNFATKINVPRAITSYSIDELLDIAGIADTSFGECMRTLYNPHKDNLDIREPIKELCKEYKLTPFRPGEPRNLIKK